MSKPYGKCVVFDLDGTLIDSREDLADSVNLMREEFGLEPLPLATIVSYVGDGLKKLVQRSLDDEDVVCPGDAYDVLNGFYRLNLINKTTLYPGVFEGIDQLKRDGWSLALVSNKPTEFCRIILDHFRIELAFSQIIGGGPEFPLKPDPAALNFILKKTKSAPERSWIMGDNHTDLEAGARAGMKRCYAAYGFGDPKELPYDLKAESFDDFVKSLAKEPY